MKCWPYFLHLSPDVDEIWYRMFAKVSEKACPERRYLYTEGVNALLSVLVIFHICCQIWAPSICESCIQSSWAPWRPLQEAPAFPTNISGTHVRVRAVEQRYSDSNERLGDICNASRCKQSRSLITFFYLNHQWLSCCATNRKVARSIPDGVIGIFHWHNPSDRTMALGSTQPLTEMSTRNISWG